MRRVVATEMGLVLTFAAGLLVAYVGLAVAVSGRDHVTGVLVLLAGVWAMGYAPVVHDRVHRERGERPHVVPGPGWRPPWWRPR